MCGGDVFGGENLEPIGTTRHLIEQGQFGLLADPGREQIVEFGQNEGRQEKRAACSRESRDRRRVSVLTTVDRREEAAGVEEYHLSPKPASIWSTFSARSGSPLAQSGGRG